MNLLEAATAFADAGISVVPAAADGSKAPLGTWKHWQTTRMTHEQITKIFSNGHPGFGVITGTVSGNLEMLELEGRAVTAGLLADMTALAQAAGIGDIWHAIAAGYCEQTPSGGVHLLYQVTGGHARPNTKLARRPATAAELAINPADKIRVLIETRGEGGFVITAPSSGPVHPTGKPWRIVYGGPSTIATITAAQRDILHQLAATFDQMPPPDPPTAFTHPSSHHSSDGSISPGDDYEQRTDWADILTPHGWELVHTRGHTRYWRRPGKTSGVSATTGQCTDRDRLYVFTTSTVFDAETPYTKFGAHALLEYGGDYHQAARALRTTGHGIPAPILPPVPAQPADTIQPLPDFDLGALAAKGITEPERIASGMLYPGSVHNLAGEPGGGKTTLLAWWMLTHIRSGGRVMLLDEESGAEHAAEKFLDLGATPGELRPPIFTYVPFPSRGWNDADLGQLHELIRQRCPTIIGWDSISAFMTIGGRDENSAADVTAFWQRVLLPCARYFGAAVVGIDHMGKSAEHGGYSRGSGAKKAASDVQFILATIKPFNRTQDGVLRLTTRPGKDRRGWLAIAYEIHVKTGKALDLDISETTTTILSERTEMTPGKAKLWEALNAVATETSPASASQLVDWIAGKYGHGLKRQTVSTFLNELAADGLADAVSDGPGTVKFWYPQDLNLSADTPMTGVSARVTPYGGDAATLTGDTCPESDTLPGTEP